MRLLLAAAALVATANAIVLAGVAYNRSGEPEAALRLTERELSVANYSWWSGERSGIGLNLQWRVPLREGSRDSYFYGSSGGEADWLDDAKLRELGFDLPPHGASEVQRGRREQERAVTLVLELDGAAHQKVLKLAQEAAAKERVSGLKPRAYGSAVEWLEREERAASRLFVVDAGRDAGALRAKYSDRTKFALVEGRVRPYYRHRGGRPNVVAHVSAVSVPSINVPLESRALFASLGYSQAHMQKGRPRYEARIAWGKRLEPRLVEARRLAE